MLKKVELDINICVVSTNVQLLRMRVGVLRGEITPFELWVDFDKFTDCDANGRLGKHPTQLDKSMNLLAELGRARRSTLGQNTVKTEN